MHRTVATYRIVCTTKESVNEPSVYEHIVAVGTGDDPDRASPNVET